MKIFKVLNSDKGLSLPRLPANTFLFYDDQAKLCLPTKKHHGHNAVIIFLSTEVTCFPLTPKKTDIDGVKLRFLTWGTERLLQRTKDAT